MPKPIPTHPTRQQEVSAWIKLLERGDNRFSTREKFLHFLELAYCAYAKRTAPDDDRANALEERYMRVVGMYEDLTTIRTVYPELMGRAALVISAGGIDFLGTIAGQINALSDEQGQFFTPYEVCRMMARLTFDSFDTEIAQHGYITMQEPACGAGAIILALADELQYAGYNPLHHMLVHAIDVSYTAYQMAFLQLQMRSIPALVVRGNTLSMEVFEWAFTPASAYFQERHGHLNFGKPLTVSPQLSLFDFDMEGAAD